jgi:hypothetical protein
MRTPCDTVRHPAPVQLGHGAGVWDRSQRPAQTWSSLRDLAARLVIATGKKKGQHPSSATVMRMLREHDEKTAAATAIG